MGIIVLGELAWHGGGYFPPAYLAAGAVVYATLAVIILVRPPHYSLSTEALVGLVALTALAIWSGISTSWSSAPDTGLEVMQRNFVYVGLFGLGLVAAGSGRLARPFVWGLCAVIVAVVAAGVLSRLYPQVLLRTSGTYRLAYPLSYHNAVAALAAMGVTLTVAVAADSRLRLLARTASAACSVLMAAGLYLTLSRGGFLALTAGGIVLVALFPRRVSLVLTILVVAIAATLAIVRLGDFQALIDAPNLGDGQAAAGARYAPQLLGFMALAGLLQAGIVVVQRWNGVATRLRQYQRPVLLSLAALCVMGALALSVEGRTFAWANTTRHFVQRQWHAVFSPPAAAKPNQRVRVTDRLTTIQGGGSRPELWRVAMNAFNDHPVRGEGAGSYEVRWYRERRLAEPVRNAHSLYLETLAEMGVVGLVLLAAFIGSLVVAATRVRRRSGVLDRGLAAGVVSVCAVWLVHAAVDWDWQITALSGLALLLAATLYPRGHRASRSETAPEA